MFGRDLRLRPQKNYKWLRAWTGSEASTTRGLQNYDDTWSGFISFPGNQKPDWKTRLCWRHGRRGTMVMLQLDS